MLNVNFELIEAIKVAGDKKIESTGREYVCVYSEDKSEKEFAEHIASLVSTGCGYMYSGEKSYLKDYEMISNEPDNLLIKHTPGKSIQLWNFIHHSHSHDDTDLQYYTKHNHQILQQTSPGTQVSIVNDCPNGTKGYLWQKMNKNNKWELIGQYDMEELLFLEQWKRMQGFVLYAGIRKDVADMLHMEVNDEFHKMFDDAVDWMSQEDIPPC